jgi:hypothetical protein
MYTAAASAAGVDNDGDDDNNDDDDINHGDWTGDRCHRTTRTSR